MKKMLTVLIIAMVAVTLFAETTATITGTTSSTELTLKASQGGKLYHGFTNDNTLDTAPEVLGVLSGAGTGSYTFGSLLSLEGEDAADQDIGYYHLYTTGNSQVKVTFDVSPLHLEVGGVHYYVPYKLDYEKTSGSQAVATGSVGSAISAYTSTTEPAGITPVSGDIVTTSGNGLRWATLALSASFNGTANSEFGLPESTGEGGTGNYTGTVVAKIAVQ